MNDSFIASHTRGVADSNDTLSLEDGTLFVTTDDDNYRLSDNELTALYPRLNGSVTANAWVYHTQPTKTIEFKYNSAGLRVQKKVTANGKSETTDYTLHGKLITHMIVGNDKLHFFYDAQSRPAKVNFNGVTYTYLHNLQGDVVGIIDNTGNLVVEYKYDAWGKPISIAGSLADTLGKHNPFRYRGYIYDEETEMYYLKTRYYKSKMKRFVNADEILGNGKALLVHNLFSYCRNHPIRRKDGGGREDVDVYDEFCDIFANTYGVSFEEYVQMPFYDKIQDAVYETENYEFLGVTKETYIEDDTSRLMEDNATTANFLGLISLNGWQAFMDAALNSALSISENTYRYTLGDIERESYTVSYKKREQYTYTDAYGGTVKSYAQIQQRHL